MEVDYHFVQERVLRRDLQVKYIASRDQLADIFTKSLSSSRFVFLRSKIMVSIAPMVLKGGDKVSKDLIPKKHCGLRLKEEEQGVSE